MDLSTSIAFSVSRQKSQAQISKNDPSLPPRLTSWRISDIRTILTHLHCSSQDSCKVRPFSVLLLLGLGCEVSNPAPQGFDLDMIDVSAIVTTFAYILFVLDRS